jgi:hypothetical protein
MILVGVAAGLGAVLAAFVLGAGAATSVAIPGALIAVLATLPAAFGYKRLPPPSRGVNWRLPYRSDILLGTAAGIVTAALAWAGAIPRVKPGIGAAVGAGIVAMLLVLLYGWSDLQKNVPFDTSSPASPPAMLARDRGTTIFVGFARWAGPAIGAGTIITLTGGVSTGIVTAVAIWCLAAVWIGLLRTPWPSYEIARIWLALHHRLPWRLMSFLTDAHRRGVLRQVGAAYQFRHIELQHRLARRA